VLVEYFRHMKLPNLTSFPRMRAVWSVPAPSPRNSTRPGHRDKRRVDMDVTEVMNLIGDVKGRSTLIVDDIIDTAGTLVKTATR